VGVGEARGWSALVVVGVVGVRMPWYPRTAVTRLATCQCTRVVAALAVRAIGVALAWPAVAALGARRVPESATAIVHVAAAVAAPKSEIFASRITIALGCNQRAVGRRVSRIVGRIVGRIMPMISMAARVRLCGFNPRSAGRLVDGVGMAEAMPCFELADRRCKGGMGTAGVSVFVDARLPLFAVMVVAVLVFAVIASPLSPDVIAAFGGVVTAHRFAKVVVVPIRAVVVGAVRTIVMPAGADAAGLVYVILACGFFLLVGGVRTMVLGFGAGSSIPRIMRPYELVVGCA